MAAIVHVKRHLDEEPLDALILNCKKRKTSDNATNDLKQVSAVLRFAGTVNEVRIFTKHNLKKQSKFPVFICRKKILYLILKNIHLVMN